MADHKSLKILEVCRVAPPPNSSSPASLSPTFFDLLWLRFPPVQRLYFYQISHTSIFFNTVLPNLKSSLSLILQHYAPLAGNFTWPQDSDKPTVEFVSGDGVLFTVAESDADFYHLSGNDFREASEYDPLIPEFPTSDERTVVMTLQVTVFEKGGFCIGIATHHALLDGKTSTAFMKSWARICKLDGRSSSPTSLSSAADLIPFYDRTMIKDPTGLEAIYINAWLNVEVPNNRSLMIWDVKAPHHSIRATFKLSPQNLQNLRLSIGHFSTFTLTTAYAWVCLAKAEEPKDTEYTEASIIVNVDARARLEPPVPSSYFGNCIVGRYVVAERERLLGENGVTIAAEAINGATKNLASGILDGAEQWISMLVSLKTGKTMVGIAGSPRFEVYSVDFGWGKPAKVEMASIDKTGAICLSDAPNGGVEISLVRQREVMETFATHFTNGLQHL